MAEQKLPLYVRVTVILFGVSLAVAILFIAKDLLIPLAFAGLLSVLLLPLADFLERHKVHRILSVTIAVLVSCVVVASAATFIGMQVVEFEEDIPRLEKAGKEYFEGIQAFVSRELGIAHNDQLKWIQDGMSKVLASGAVIGQAFLALVGITTLAVLLPLYAFLMLLYRDLIFQFFIRLFPARQTPLLKDVLRESLMAMKNYTFGLAIETAIVAVLNTVALLLLGIEHAILFGVIAAVLNLIPYVGILIGSLLPVAMALISHDSVWYPLGVVGAYVLIQFIDNNFIVPYVVGSRVRINALVSVVVVIMGGMLWGIPGMFLALPAAAVLKLIFDRVEALKPWGLLLGDRVPADRSSKS